MTQHQMDSALSAACESVEIRVNLWRFTCYT
jgi:hypothetical protein